MHPRRLVMPRRGSRWQHAFFETPNDGAVFSTGSVTWGTSLTHNGCDNNVSRITGNVVDRFVSES
jgi:N,N-dimethylformamidase